MTEHADQPNVARIYDYLLGGKDHFAADRQAAQRLVAALPNAAAVARANRAFLAAAVRYAARAGIAQYLDIGAVVERMGLQFGKQAGVAESPGNIEGRTLPATWVLLTSNRGLVENPRIQALAGGATSRPATDVWTDDYSNLFRVLK